METRHSLAIALGFAVVLTSAAGSAAPRVPNDPAAASDLTLLVADSTRKLGTVVPGAVLDPMVAPVFDRGVVYKSTSIKCGDTTYEVSTGNNGGKCGVVDVGGKKFTRCTDGKGNFAYASCSGCDQAGGTGSCTIKSAD